MYVVGEIFFKKQWTRAKPTLSGFSWNLGLCAFLFSPPSPRADPYANTEEKDATPMDIAVKKDNFEVLVVLAGFAEVPADTKLNFLRMILENKGEEQYAAEFKKNLEGLSVSEVGSRVSRSSS